jgi:hypothetical protein
MSNYVICLAILVIIAVPTVSAVSYTNRLRPLINVTFEEPVTVVSATVNDDPSLIQQQSGDQYFFKFIAARDLGEGSYTFSITVRDRIGNVNTFTKDFVVDRTPPKITLSIHENDVIRKANPVVTVELTEPANTTYVELNKKSVTDLFMTSDQLTYTATLPLEDGEALLYVFSADHAGNADELLVKFTVAAKSILFTLVDPANGVAQHQPFDVVFMTHKWAACRYSIGEDLAYDDMARQAVTSNHTHHTVPNVPSATMLYVACEDEYGTTENNSKAFELFVDWYDPAIISAYATPAVVEDKPSTTLTVITDEDARCRYSSSSSTPFDAMTPFPGYDTFGTHSNVTISTPTTNANYSYYVQCEDRALRRSGKVEIEIRVNLGFPLEIRDHTRPAFTTTTAVLDFSTNKRALCYYSNSSVRKTENYLGTGYDFEKSLYLAEGSFRFYLYCYKAPDDIDEYDEEEVRFSIDTSRPVMLYVNDSNPELPSNPGRTFRTDRLFAKWRASDDETGITYYEVTVYEEGYLRDTLVYNNTMEEEGGWIYIPLENGKRYVFKVKAMNGAWVWSEMMSSDGITVDTTAYPEWCSNDEKDHDETDRDCGGATCPRCGVGRICDENSDCITDYCNSSRLCDKVRCNKDGVADPGEACDGSDIRDKTCADFDDFVGGNLRCNEHCDYDTSQCLVCDNDGNAEKGEGCDGSDLRGMDCTDFGFTGGRLACGQRCEYDTSGCELLVCDNDGRQEFGEACDCGGGTCYDDQLDYRSCTDFGFRGGMLGCSDRCEFDTGFCYSCDNDGAAEPGEACDGSDLRGMGCQDFEGYFDGVLACHPDCRFDFSRCLRHDCNHNLIAELGEACDGTDLRGKDCSDFGGFSGGTLTCNDDCEFDTLGCTSCNENDLAESWEACDGLDLRDMSCSDFDEFESGRLSCDGCEYSTGSCRVGLCDNDHVADPGEACDGVDLRGKSCDDFGGFTGGTLACLDCEYLTEGCVVCDGDNVAEKAESCDGSDLRGKRCVDFAGFSGGVLQCVDCEYMTGECTLDVTSGCDNDGIAEEGEACDGSDLNSRTCMQFDDFTGGDLRCTEGCAYDTSSCTVCDQDSQAEKGEACDGSDLRGLGCTDFGFTGGDLSCTNDCEFDTSGCEMQVCDDNGNREYGEACDCGGGSCTQEQLDYMSCADFGVFSGGMLGCSDECDFDTSFCYVCDSDGVADPGEACDGSDLRGMGCQDFEGYFDGILTCSQDCRYDFGRCLSHGCNSNNNAELGEACDGTDLRGKDCSDFGGFSGGTLTCNDDCEFDTLGCSYCDNDQVADVGEVCDGSDLRGMKCADFDEFETGVLGCQNCQFVTSSCKVGICNRNGIAEPGEACDGSGLRGKDCADFGGFTGGTLRCDEDCEFDTGSCIVCDNDGIAEKGESCDGSDMRGMRCLDFEGFLDGTLGCTNDCEFDTRRCNFPTAETCDNDGLAELGEACDGDDLKGKLCEHFDNFAGGTLRCKTDCNFDTSRCLTCDSDGVAEDGEACDGSDLRGKSCASFGYTGGALSCTSFCGYDTSACEFMVCDNDGSRDFGEACDCGGQDCTSTQLNYRQCTHLDSYLGGELSCTDSCDYDTRSCYICDNDGAAEPGEACDGSDLRGKGCTDFEGYFDGALACSGDCTYDFSRCLRHECDNNGVAELGEACDGSDLRGRSCADFGGFTAGLLRCNGQCEFDTLGCTHCDNDGTADPGEACDGSDLRGMKCVDFDEFETGVLGCQNCQFVTSSCKVGLCDRDGTADPGEECDGNDLRDMRCEDFGGATGGLLGCYDNCLFNTEGCVLCDNDGTAEPGEACDGSDLRGKRCSDFRGFSGGTLGCIECDYDTTGCEIAITGQCDNDGVAEASEACDGTDLKDKVCTDFDEFTGGKLRCNNYCDFDTSLCTVCDGDGVAELGEACDGSDLRVKVCSDFPGFSSGTLACSSCNYDFSGCLPVSCNNDNTAAPGEACDGSDLRGKGCSDFGFTGGSLRCDAQCAFDTVSCTVCDGDGIAEPGEACDGSDLDGMSCKDFGFAGGKLKCIDCEFVTEQCTTGIGDTCSNGVQDGDESDTDCGGSCSPCSNGERCMSDGDCGSGVCDVSTGRCTPEHCVNNRLDAQETDIDCGGVCTRKCDIGQFCIYDDDCVAGALCVDEVCLVCESGDLDCDGIANDADSDIDGDGIPNWEDPDDDNDGLCDTADSPLNDQSCSGDDDDDDNDGTLDVNEVDSDNDLDNDGIENEQDDDIDGDGINNINDVDDDNDGVEDSIDDDDDNDGRLDEEEDTDGDGMPDGWELDHGLDPNDSSDAGEDLDKDDLSNKDEYIYETNPEEKDTDGDGWSDGKEVKKGTSPKDPDDHPRSAFVTVLLIIIILGLFGVGGYFGYMKYMETQRRPPGGPQGAAQRPGMVNRVMQTRIMQSRPMRPIAQRLQSGPPSPQRRVYKERERLRDKVFDAFKEKGAPPAAASGAPQKQAAPSQPGKKDGWVPIETIRETPKVRKAFDRLAQLRQERAEGEVFNRLSKLTKSDAVDRLRTMSAASKAGKGRLVDTLHELHQKKPLSRDHVHDVLSHLVKRKKLPKSDIGAVLADLKSREVLSHEDAQHIGRRLKK